MKLKSLVLMMGLLGGLQAQAALTTYVGFGASATSSETSFSGVLVSGSRKIDTLEGIDPNDTPALINGFPASQVNLFGTSLTANDGQAHMTGSGAITSQTPTSGGRAPHSGSLYLEGLQDPFTITFNSAVKAFGFWGSDIGDFTGSGDCGDAAGCAGSGAPVLRMAIQFNQAITLSAADQLNDCSLFAANILHCNISGGQSNGSQMFWGMTSTSNAAIEKVTFTNLTASPTANILDGQGFDDFTLGDVRVTDTGGDPNNRVPEPAALSLVGLALLAAGAQRRRRKS
jgi:hypothetical protein